MSNPTWLALSVHKDSTEQQGHKEVPELHDGKTTHIAAFTVLVRKTVPKNMTQRDNTGDSGSLQAPVTLKMDCTIKNPVGKGQHWLNHFGNRPVNQP